ncbi:MAG: hypothetical protein ACR2LK_14695 [Solirubrobacteraceae bacterium]
MAQLLAELDAMLRDPTLTRALSSFARKVSTAVRGLLAAVADAARRLPSLRLRLPRRLLLGLLALALPFALLALLAPGDDRRPVADSGEPSARASAPPQPGERSSAAGASMPRLAGAPEKVGPVGVALVLDGKTYDDAQQARELRALGTWLEDNHAPGTRVSVIDAASGRTSGALRPEDLGRAPLTRDPTSTGAAVRSAFADQDQRRLLVTLGSKAPPSNANTLTIATRRGAPPDRALAKRGRRARATIDDRRPDALAASVARGIMQISGQSERR